MTPFDVTLRYELRDWIRFYGFGSRQAWRAIAGVGAVFALGGFTSGGLAMAIWMSAGIVGFFAIGFPLVLAHRAVRKARWQPDGGAITLRIAADGIDTESGGSSSHFPWSVVGRRINTRHFMLIEVPDRKHCVWMPLRLLTASELATASDWLTLRGGQQTELASAEARTDG